MQHDLMGAVTAFVQRLVALASQDEGLRDHLRMLAEAVLNATENSSALSSSKPGGHGDDGDEAVECHPDLIKTEEREPEVVLVVSQAFPEAVILPELTLGRSRPAEADIETSWFHPSASKAITSDADLPAVEAHCRLKADGVRWASIRRRRLDEGAEFRFDIAPRDKEILDRARSLNCYLWMNTPDFAVPRESASLEELPVASRRSLMPWN